MKDYYCYVRPISVNKPWNLERMPLGKSVLKLDPCKLHKLEPIRVQVKLSDDCKISVVDNTKLKLPTSDRYLMTSTFNIKKSGDGMIKLSIIDCNGDLIDSMSSYSLSNEPVTITRTTVISPDNDCLSIINETGSAIELIDGLITLSRLD